MNDVIKMIARVYSETFFCLPKSIIGIVQTQDFAANFDKVPSGFRTCIKNGLLMVVDMNLFVSLCRSESVKQSFHEPSLTRVLSRKGK